MEKTATAVLVNGMTTGFKTVSVPSNGTSVGFESIRKVINCDAIDVVELQDSIDIWVDDEGLLKSENIVREITVKHEGEIREFHLAGDLLFMGRDEEGYTIELNNEQIEEIHMNVSIKLYGKTR